MDRNTYSESDMNRDSGRERDMDRDTYSESDMNRDLGK
jgi:hypothetical protein